MRTIARADLMFRAAQLVGEAMQLANADGRQGAASIKISRLRPRMLLGGRIGDAPPSLFLIYSAGNFIECKPDMPFFQIGETKYGRPILDRTIEPATLARRGDEDRLPLASTPRSAPISPSAGRST